VRRAVLALAGTAAGTAVLIAVRLGPAPGSGLLAGDPGATGAPGSTAAGGPPGTLPSAPRTSATAGAATAPGAGATPTRPKTTAPAPGSGFHDGTYIGPTVQTRYGPVQVKIIISGARMTDVVALQLPSSHDESVRINNRAEPILRQEALAAQSATIATVSGATYTSDGYRQSLQASIDLARK
jgi:uncharacterized protein with FMN-binding domain